ncbi:hypothetical protein H5410_040262 [Solanum commersonii]|uniref:Uncharacterized protein n=1 Tax=Solanum commersonii TaxID=4109 RepID=A0A9J5XQV9_SOLCO|nr:hypothetical protein H5410_040262 [Solanum commersonii]
MGIETKFFHAYVKGRRRKLQISEIKTRQRDVIISTQNEEMRRIPIEEEIEEVVPAMNGDSSSGPNGAKNKHRVAWDKMCYPKNEGGLGLRSLHDVKARNSIFWFDNWTKQGELYHIEDTAREEELENILPPNFQRSNDIAWWMTHSHGRFTVKSA